MRALVVSAATALIIVASAGADAQSPKPGAHHPPSTAPIPAQPPAGPGDKMPGDKMPGGTMPGGMMGGGMMPGGMMGAMVLQHVEGRLAFLKAELKIVPAQEALWAPFADAVRTASRNIQAATKPMMQPDTAQPRTAVERMARYESVLAARLESTRLIKAAFDPLYAGLDNEQRKLADVLVGEVIGIR